jgi:hypothetical protein
LNRLELSKPEPSRYHKISYDAEAVDRQFVDLFLEAHRTAPGQITLDLDATDDQLHGEQGRALLSWLLQILLLPSAVYFLRGNRTAQQRTCSSISCPLSAQA